MIIANPIYDAVFKYLLEDTNIARFILSTIIGEEIIDIEVKPQEHAIFSDFYLVKVFRVDFKATVQTKEGESKKILIELQKGKQLVDIMRFRRYLGENYQREDEIKNEKGEIEKRALPIITIYILGFTLENLPIPVIKSGRLYINVDTQEVLTAKNEFIEAVTHDCYVIQIPHLSLGLQTKLQKVLAVFNQKYILSRDDKRILNIPNELTDDEIIKQILDRLAKAAMNEDVRKQIEAEEEIENAIERTLRERDRIIEAKDKEIENKDKEIENKDKEIENKGKEIENKDKEIENKDKEIENKDKEIEQLRRLLEEERKKQN
jgi:molecular chaperone DnaK (HSP70)